MLTVLRQRNFALMWWSGLISFAGDWMMMIARPLFVYELTGSALATSLMFIVGMLPRVVLGSVAGVFVDRWDRQRVMVIANVLLAVAILPMMLVRTADMLWIVYVSAFCTAILSQFLYPAENAFLPTLVEEQYLVPANSLNNLNNHLSRLIGPALGGVIMANAGFGTVVLVDAATFIIGGLMIAAIRLNAQKPQTTEKSDQPEAPNFQRIWQEWLAGLQLVRQSPTLTLLFIGMAITSIGEGTMGVLFTPFATEILKTDAVGIGMLMSAQAVGGIVGGVLIAKMGEKISPWALAGWGALLLGIIDLALFNYSFFFTGFWFAILTLIIVGVPAAGAGTGIISLLQKGAEDAYRGRVFGALMTTTALFSLLGMILAGAFGEIIGPIFINVQSVVHIIVGVMVLMRREIPAPNVAMSQSESTVL